MTTAMAAPLPHPTHTKPATSNAATVATPAGLSDKDSKDHDGSGTCDTNNSRDDENAIGSGSEDSEEEAEEGTLRKPRKAPHASTPASVTERTAAKAPTATTTAVPTLEGTALPAVRASRSKLTLDRISKHFALTLAEAAKELDVCVTALKKACRKYGLRRWPHRKLKAIERSVSKLSPAATPVGADAEAVAREKREHLSRLLQTNPGSLLRLLDPNNTNAAAPGQADASVLDALASMREGQPQLGGAGRGLPEGSDLAAMYQQFTRNQYSQGFPANYPMLLGGGFPFAGALPPQAAGPSGFAYPPPMMDYQNSGYLMMQQQQQLQMMMMMQQQQQQQQQQRQPQTVTTPPSSGGLLQSQTATAAQLQLQLQQQAQQQQQQLLLLQQQQQQQQQQQRALPRQDSLQQPANLNAPFGMFPAFDQQAKRPF